MQALLALLFALIALVMAWSLVRASRTGTIRSRGWTARRAENPVGFWFIAIIDVAILVVSLGFVLHALGLIGGFPTSLTIPLPRYH